MGNSDSASAGIHNAVDRAEKFAGRIAVHGRYHQLPKKLSDDYDQLGTVLGKGYNGEVFMAKSKTSSQKFAVKPFKLNGLAKEKREEIANESEIFLDMDHPHVARLLDVYEGSEELFLVVECLTGGELFQRISERKVYSEKDAAEAVHQMLLAVNYIHSHNIVHRDIKLENFLYESKDSDHLKLIDFGFSKVWTPNTRMDNSCGTLSYVAPEVLAKSYTSQCDLWSLGVVAFILLVGYMPFCGPHENQVKGIKSGQYLVKPDRWRNVSAHATSFVKSLLVVQPEQRLTAEGALKHPFIAERAALKGGSPSATSDSLDNTMVDALCNFGQASCFRRACLNMMAWSLTNEERKKLRDAFLELDKDNSGCIQAAEFKKVLETEFHISDKEAAAAFEALDANHHEEIHYSEFLAATACTRIAMHDDLLKSTFKRFDADGSGFIEVSDLKGILGESYDGGQIEKMLADADVSHDGKISLDEFMNYMRNPNSDAAHLDAAASLVDKGVQKGEKAVEPTLKKKVIVVAPGESEEEAAKTCSYSGRPTAPKEMRRLRR